MEQITRVTALGGEKLDRSQIIQKSESNTERNADPKGKGKDRQIALLLTQNQLMFKGLLAYSANPKNKLKKTTLHLA